MVPAFVYPTSAASRAAAAASPRRVSIPTTGDGVSSITF